MRQQEMQVHYNQYYKYQGDIDEVARLEVNRLLPSIQRNDQQAFSVVLRIIREKAFFNICRQVAGGKFDTLDFVDDIMQFASMEYAKKSMGGFADIGHDNFYAYSLKFFSVCATHYISRYNQKIFSREAWMDESADEKLRNIEAVGKDSSPERAFWGGEQEDYEKECIMRYMRSIAESKTVPHQLITYCYAAVLPQVLKDHRNIPGLLRWINILNRPGEKPSSWADEATGAIGGRIARDSDYLLKWAIDAMYQKDVAQLSDEFVEIHNIRPLTGQNFSWGSNYCENLQKWTYLQARQEQAQEKDMVVTDEFQELAMKNWMPRIGKSLMKEVVAEVMKKPQLRTFAVKYASRTMAKKKCADVKKGDTYAYSRG